jgi:hypothetical protein
MVARGVAQHQVPDVRRDGAAVGKGGTERDGAEQAGGEPRASGAGYGRVVSLLQSAARNQIRACRRDRDPPCEHGT